MRANRKKSLCLPGALFIVVLTPLCGAKPYDLQGFLSFAFPGMIQPAADFSQELAATILLELRLPRLIAAVLCGSSLSLAGVLSQGLFGNPLADPGILGCSGASSLFVLALYLSGLQWLSGFAVPLTAFAGALLSSMVLLLLAGYHRNQESNDLLLFGVALSSLWGALSSLLISLSVSRPQVLQSVTKWFLGSLQGSSWPLLAWGTGPCLVAIVWALKISRSLDILALGSEVAESLGLSAYRLRVQAISCLSLLTALSVSLAGPLPFVGLIVPHTTRMLTGPGHYQLMLYSIANGASLVVLADLCARSLLTPVEMEPGVLTALMGAPFFIWLLSRQIKDSIC